MHIRPLVWYTVGHMQEIPIVQGFTAGELSPWLSSRCDLQAYQRGAALISNFQIQPYGGLQLRPGTLLLFWGGYPRIRIVPFYYSERDVLMLAFDEGGMWAYKDGKAVVRTFLHQRLISLDWSQEDLERAHFTQVNDELYVCSPSCPPFVIRRFTDTEWALEDISFESMPRETYARQEGSMAIEFDESGTSATLEISGGHHAFSQDMAGKEYLLADATIPGKSLFCNEVQKIGASTAPDLSTSSVAKGTVLQQKNAKSLLYYFYHCIRDYTPDAFNGSLDLDDYPYYFQPGIMRLDDSQLPYEVIGDWEIHTVDTWSACWELWRSYDTLEEEPDFRLWDWTCVKSFSQTDYETRQNWALSGSESRPCRMVLVCRCCKDAATLGAFYQFKVLGGRREYKFRITEVVDETHAKAELLKKYLDNPVSFSTRNWSFGAIGVRNGYPAFSALFQGRLWIGGMPGLPTTLLASVTDDYFNFHMGSNDDDALHLSIMDCDQSRICWITATRQLLVGTSDSEWSVSSSSGNAITPSSVILRRQSSVGSEPIPARAVENTVLFVQRGARRMREIAYRLESDGYAATDISMLAEHLFASGIKEWCLQRGANFNIWVLMNDGSVAVLTINLDQQVTAWQRVRFMHRSVLSLGAVPSKSGQADEMWFLTRNMTSGNVALERMLEDNPHIDAIFTMSAQQSGCVLRFDLPDEQQKCLYDPETGDCVPCGELGYESPWIIEGNKYMIGYPIEAEVHTMPLESNISFNSVRQFSRFKLRLLHSDTGFDFRSSANDAWEHVESCSIPGTSHDFTGAVRLSLMPDAAVGQALCIRYTGGRDFRILAISQEVDHHGK